MTIDEIRSLLRERLARNGTPMSPLAIEILTRSIAAITEDPHPEWHGVPTFTDTSPDALQEDAVHGVALKAMSLRGKLLARHQSELTTFDVLHHLSFWVDDLCPFEKPATPP